MSRLALAGARALDDSAELDPDDVGDLEQALLGSARTGAQELHDCHDLLADEDRGRRRRSRQ